MLKRNVKHLNCKFQTLRKHWFGKISFQESIPKKYDFFFFFSFIEFSTTAPN